ERGVDELEVVLQPPLDPFRVEPSRTRGIWLLSVSRDIARKHVEHDIDVLDLVLHRVLPELVKEVLYRVPLTIVRFVRRLDGGSEADRRSRWHRRWTPRRPDGLGRFLLPWRVGLILVRGSLLPRVRRLPLQAG